ncbi:MAG TPA: hypothetical protein VMR25_15470 [Planctomycetaceae bacterium]|jgi:hypothetical protein|nr:hypothetical protein [Planctomycetaceae bacterium]
MSARGAKPESSAERRAKRYFVGCLIVAAACGFIAAFAWLATPFAWYAGPQPSGLAFTETRGFVLILSFLLTIAAGVSLLLSFVLFLVWMNIRSWQRRG